MLTGTDTQVVRGETLGPLVRDQLRDLFGTHRITITPVIHQGTEPAVDSYEIPDRIRQSVQDVERGGCQGRPPQVPERRVDDTRAIRWSGRH